jgi:hypothetical protein
LDKKHEYYERVKNSDEYKERSKNRVRDYKKEMASLKANPYRNIKSKLRKITCNAFSRKKNPKWVIKNNKTEQLLGADFFTVKEFLERQFLSGMNWDNYGTMWNVDHVIPLDVAGYDVEMISKLCYYQNLSPTWSTHNFSKGYKVPSICTLWENPIVPYKVTDIVIVPRYNGIVVEKYKLVVKHGERYGKLTVIRDAEPQISKSGSEKRMVYCKCDCGKEKNILLNTLRQGKTISCGCQHILSIKEYNKNNPSKVFTVDEIKELMVITKDLPKGSIIPKEVVDKFKDKTYKQLLRIVRRIRDGKIDLK